MSQYYEWIFYQTRLRGRKISHELNRKLVHVYPVAHWQIAKRCQSSASNNFQYPQKLSKTGYLLGTEYSCETFTSIAEETALSVCVEMFLQTLIDLCALQNTLKWNFDPLATIMYRINEYSPSSVYMY